MSIKDIYKRLNLTSDLAKEKRRFIERIKGILLEAYEYINAQKIKSEIAFMLGEPIPDHITNFINSDFERALIVIEIFLRVIHGSHTEYYNYFKFKVEAVFDFSIIDLGYGFKDGKIYKKAAAELDEKLILEPLEWLSDFPQAREPFEDALREYLKKDYPDAITKSYSALESLVKTFLDNNKNLKANSAKLVENLDLPKEWGNILFNFCQYANEFSSRHGKREGGRTIQVEPSLVEAYIHFTGLVMRLIIKSAK